MGDINLYIDRRAKSAVFSLSNPARYSPLPNLPLSDKQKFNIHIWDFTGNTSAPFFEVPDLDGYSLRMAIATTGASTATKASETNWTWDATEKRFSGTIDLSQSDLVTALAGLEELDMKIEISVVDPDGNRTHILREDITVERVADIVATPSSPHADTFFTSDEINNMFIRRRHQGAIVLVSSDGTTQVTLSCDAAKLKERGAPVV